MEPGIMLYIKCRASLEEQIETLKRVGVRRTFINAGCPNLDEIVQIAREAGLIFDNFHSDYNGFKGVPFQLADLCRDSKERECLLNAHFENILSCKKHGVSTLVVHTPRKVPGFEFNTLCADGYTAIADFARKHGVTLAFENIRHLDLLAKVFEIVPDGKFCWDIGHWYYRFPEVKMSPMFGNRLVTLHVHDNHLTNDEHLLPLDGIIDYRNVAKELVDSGFDGTLMLESMYRRDYETAITYEEYVLRGKQAAEKIIGMVEELRS